jgi:RNA polymerase sigma-70 factor (ECF subfamily)
MKQLDVITPSETSSETTLVAKAITGDVAAWATLVQTHQAVVFRFAYLILHNPATAEDVAQDVFIRAFQQLDKFDTTRPLRPWLLGVTKNLAYNQHRSAKRYWGMVQRFFQQTPTSYTPSLGARLDGNADAEMLREAVSQLSKKGQEVIYLRYFMGLSENETADTLGIPTGTVKSRTHRALGQLRNLIAGNFPALWETYHEA